MLINKDMVRFHIKSTHGTLENAAPEMGFSETTLSNIQCGKQAIPEWMETHVKSGSTGDVFRKVGIKV